MGHLAITKIRSEQKVQKKLSILNLLKQISDEIIKGQYQQSMSGTSVERVSSPNHFAELQLTGIEPETLVTGPSNSTT